MFTRENSASANFMLTAALWLVLGVCEGVPSPSHLEAPSAEVNSTPAHQSNTVSGSVGVTGTTSVTSSFAEGMLLMTRSIVLTNNKGGVGKSTSATNIALGLVGLLRQAGASNPRVLLVDTDSQAHATLVTTGRNDFGTDDSLYTMLMADRSSAPQTLANCIVPSSWDDNYTSSLHLPCWNKLNVSCRGPQERLIAWPIPWRRSPHTMPPLLSTPVPPFLS
jgi:hypothetical protein